MSERSPERLTWPQICARYPERWVVLIEMDWPIERCHDPRSAVVLDSGDEAYALALYRSQAFRDTDVARLFTGKRRGQPRPSPTGLAG